MTTLLEVTIEGLAGRGDAVHYALNRNLNIFFGLNGSGKTSLLKIIDAGFDDENESISNLAFRSARIKFYSAMKNLNVIRSISSQRESDPRDRESDIETVERRSYERQQFYMPGS